MSSRDPSGKNFDCAPHFLWAFAIFVSQRHDLGDPLTTIFENLLPPEGAFSNKYRFSLNDLSRVCLQVEFHLQVISNFIFVFIDQGDAQGCVKVASVGEARHGL
jgi:hypothetical protein